MGEFKDPNMNMPAPKQPEHNVPAPEKPGEASDTAKPTFDAEAQRRIGDAVWFRRQQEIWGGTDGMESETYNLQTQLKHDDNWAKMSQAERDEVNRILKGDEKADNDKEQGGDKL